MPKRSDITTVMVIGSGPITIGQAGEFDYSGTQGCKALKEEGCRIVLVNSNPATVMTDTAFSDRTYMEPLTLETATDIIRKERPDAILPTLGGQTALNLAMDLHHAGILKKYGVEMIGARAESIELAENRHSFQHTMRRIGLDIPKSCPAYSVSEALQLIADIQFPAVVRPSYTLGGAGGGIAYNLDELKKLARQGIEASPIHQVLIEESVLGWKEIELEVMRDSADNAIVVCGIENLDPMGVHTGDSITVAPVQTLSDVEYQALRADALAVVRAIGVDTGGCNIQFAINPQTGRRVVIEMNPRVSRSSALASKATGFPIARVAAKLALGYRLDEIKNSITNTSACFEPVIDYCVVKVPRFNFEKFSGSDTTLGLQMRSVGETMALGGNFREALQKALRGLETGLAGLEQKPNGFAPHAGRLERLEEIRQQLFRTGPERLLQLYEALALGMSLEEARAITGIDPWFIRQLQEIIRQEQIIVQEFAPLFHAVASQLGLAKAPDAQSPFVHETAVDKPDLPACRDLPNIPCLPNLPSLPNMPDQPERQGLSDTQGLRGVTEQSAATSASGTPGQSGMPCQEAISGLPDMALPLFRPELPAGTGKNDFSRSLRHIKAQGFSDARIAFLVNKGLNGSTIPRATENTVRAVRMAFSIQPAFRSVDSCAGEFEAYTPYFYSTYDAAISDAVHTDLLNSARLAPAPPRPDGSPLPRKVVILGGGPNRIGQGVEFDYCCVQACFALKELGITSIMVNSNPETVSTDFDTADRLYFEPVTIEDVLAICEIERPDGVIMQFGGQTPLNIAQALEEAGVPILGTSPASISLAEDRESFSKIVTELGIPQPASHMAHNEESACRMAQDIGYPVMARPSFVLGGQAMRIIHNESELRVYMKRMEAGLATDTSLSILIDKFLEEAIEVDVDAVVDRHSVTIAAVLEHIEQAGIHSGDSCCSIPTHTLNERLQATIREYTVKLGLALGTVGLFNVQMAVYKDTVHVIEANPRASRTIPFVSKATGVNVAGIACKVMTGLTLEETGFTSEPSPAHHSVKEAVIPFSRFPGEAITLGPEMRSTGEVMGIDSNFGLAFLKSQAAAGMPIPLAGNIVLTVTDNDKQRLVALAKRLVKLGFRLYATPGTKEVLDLHGVTVDLVVKIGPQRPHLLDFLRNGEASMIVNTVSGSRSLGDAITIRAEALARGITLLTTLAALHAAVEGLEARQQEKGGVSALQDYYAKPQDV